MNSWLRIHCRHSGRSRVIHALTDFAMTWSTIWQKLRSVSDLGRPRDALALMDFAMTWSKTGRSFGVCPIWAVREMRCARVSGGWRPVTATAVRPEACCRYALAPASGTVLTWLGRPRPLRYARRRAAALRWLLHLGPC